MPGSGYCNEPMESRALSREIEAALLGSAPPDHFKANQEAPSDLTPEPSSNSEPMTTVYHPEPEHLNSSESGTRTLPKNLEYSKESADSNDSPWKIFLGLGSHYLPRSKQHPSWRGGFGFDFYSGVEVPHKLHDPRGADWRFWAEHSGWQSEEKRWERAQTIIGISSRGGLEETLFILPFRLYVGPAFGFIQSKRFHGKSLAFFEGISFQVLRNSQIHLDCRHFKQLKWNPVCGISVDLNF